MDKEGGQGMFLVYKHHAFKFTNSLYINIVLLNSQFGQQHSHRAVLGSLGEGFCR